MRKILKLIRYENLLFIVLIQYFMRYLVINPMLSNHNLGLLFSEFHFALLVLSTVLLAASGYIINNTFDAELDKKAGKKVVVNDLLTKNQAMNLHVVLNIIAIVIGFYISIVINLYKIGFIFVIIAGLLWFYSSSYKKMFLVGNLMIALLAGFVPFILILFEIPLQYDLNKEFLIKSGQNLNDIIIWISGFSIFAFILTLIREIIKDIEDIDGDMMFNANTVPIILGIKTTKVIISVLISITIIALIYIITNYLTGIVSVLYISLLVILPLIFLIVKNFQAKNSKDFHFLSIFVKLIMIVGVFYSIVVFFS